MKVILKPVVKCVCAEGFFGERCELESQDVKKIYQEPSVWLFLADKNNGFFWKFEDWLLLASLFWAKALHDIFAWDFLNSQKFI